MSEKLIAQQQAGFVRRAKTSRRNTADLVGACPGGKFVVSSAGDAYDAPESEPNRKSRSSRFFRNMQDRHIGAGSCTIAAVINESRWIVSRGHSCHELDAISSSHTEQ